MKNSPQGLWKYRLFEGAVPIYVVKLNENSKKCFRVEGQINDEVLSLLVENSKDPTFIGYPYGLIEADKFARVSNEEKDHM